MVVTATVKLACFEISFSNSKQRLYMLCSVVCTAITKRLCVLYPCIRYNVLYSRSIKFMQGGHCTCLSKAVEVSGVCLHILTIVEKASKAFFVGQTHECKRMLDSTMHRGVVFSITRAPAAIH